MKHFIVVLAIGVFLFGCRQKENEADTVATASIHASSMVCGSCAKTVKNAVTRIEGVKEVSVDLESKMVQVKYIPEKTTLESLEKAITDAGYDADNQKRNAEAYEKLDKCCKIDG